MSAVHAVCSPCAVHKILRVAANTSLENNRYKRREKYSTPLLRNCLSMMQGLGSCQGLYWLLCSTYFRSHNFWTLSIASRPYTAGGVLWQKTSPLCWMLGDFLFFFLTEKKRPRSRKYCTQEAYLHLTQIISHGGSREKFENRKQLFPKTQHANKNNQTDKDETCRAI